MTQERNISTANRASALLYDYAHKYPGTYLVPVNVCPDVPLTLLAAGAKIKFVDIDADTLCADIDECIRLINESPQLYTGLVYVRTYGCMVDMSVPFSRIRSVSRPDFRIVDDRCLCEPSMDADLDGADMALFSTGRCKQVDLGHGGLAVYADNNICEFKHIPTYYGTDEETLYKAAFSENRQLDSLPQGWLKVAKCEFSAREYENLFNEGLKRRVRHRQLINTIYYSRLPKSLQLPDVFQNWRFNIVVDESVRDSLLRAVFDAGLFASAHYRPVNTLFEGQCDDCFPHANRLWRKVINLFNDDHYTEQMAIKTCDIILHFLQSTEQLKNNSL